MSENIKLKDFLENTKKLKIKKITNENQYRFRDKSFKLLNNDKLDFALRKENFETDEGDSYLNRPYITPHDFIYDPYSPNAKTGNVEHIVKNPNSTFNKTMKLMRGDSEKPDNYFNRDGMMFLDHSFTQDNETMKAFSGKELEYGSIINAGMYNVLSKLVEIWSEQSFDPIETTLPADTKNKRFNEKYHLRNLFDMSEYIDLSKETFPQKKNLYNYFKTDLVSIPLETETGIYKSTIGQSFGSNLLDTNFSTNQHMASIYTKLDVDEFDGKAVIHLDTVKTPYIYMKSNATFIPPNIYIIIRGIPIKMRCNKVSKFVAIYSWPEYLINVKEIIDSMDYLHISGHVPTFEYYVGGESYYKNNIEIKDKFHVFNNITHKNSLSQEQL